jgi:methionine aminotransferase
MAKRLVTDFGVACIPVSAFYTKPVDDKILRFCFAKKQATLEQAVERLVKL